MLVCNTFTKAKTTPNFHNNIWFSAAGWFQLPKLDDPLSYPQIFPIGWTWKNLHRIFRQLGLPGPSRRPWSLSPNLHRRYYGCLLVWLLFWLHPNFERVAKLESFLLFVASLGSQKKTSHTHFLDSKVTRCPNGRIPWHSPPNRWVVAQLLSARCTSQGSEVIPSLQRFVASIECI